MFAVAAKRRTALVAAALIQAPRGDQLVAGFQFQAGEALGACGVDTEGQLFQVDLDARGPLTLEELDIDFSALGVPGLGEDGRRCVLDEVAAVVQVAGDPETVDPATVEFLSDGSENWSDLGPGGRRIILAQAITTEAFFHCISES